MSLKDKVVLITEGGSGIGADAAQAFYKAGAKIVLNGRRESLLAQTAHRIDPTGEHVVFLADNEFSSWITGVVLPVDGGVTAGRN